MNLRKLLPKEHQRTRRLWEKIFTEDTKVFLDYYYSVKTKENEIFAVEDEGEIIAMLHLNPYQMRIRDNVYSTNYIVAVATDERYRKQGIMAELLKASMKEMYRRKEPFTFLMPAAEAIYYPHDFRFIYRQRRGKAVGKNRVPDSMELVPVEEKDCESAAEFANRFLENYQVTTERDASYYKTLIAEQKSESGGVVMAKKQGELVGVFCYAKEGEIEIREPLFWEKTDFEQAVYELTRSETKSVKCIAYGDEKKEPMIMARILHLETFLKSLSLKEEADFFIRVQDSLLKGNEGVFHITGDRESGIVLAERINGEANPCCTIGIGELTGVLFGYQETEDDELRKIEPLKKVFLNEIV